MPLSKKEFFEFFNIKDYPESFYFYLAMSYIDQCQTDNIDFPSFLEYLQKNSLKITYSGSIALHETCCSEELLPFLNFFEKGYVHYDTDYLSSLNIEVKEIKYVVFNTKKYKYIYSRDTTLLHEAAIHQDFALIKKLVSNGADINIRAGEETDIPPLFNLLSINRNRIEMIKNISHIKKMGANLYFKTHDDKTILDYCIKVMFDSDKLLALVKFFLKKGVMFDKKAFDSIYEARKAIGRSDSLKEIYSLLTYASTLPPPENLLPEYLDDALPFVPTDILKMFGSYRPLSYNYFFQKAPGKPKILLFQFHEDKKEAMQVSIPAKKSKCAIQ